MSEEPYETIGKELDRKLSSLEELWEYCIKLGERIANIEKELRERKESPELIETQNEENGHETVFHCQVPEGHNPPTNEIEVSKLSPETMYMSATKTVEGIVLTKVDDSMQNYVPFKIEAMGGEAEVHINPLYEWDKDTLETKLLTYVDYKIISPAGEKMIPTSTGKALLKNGTWMLIIKPQIVIE